MDFWVCYIFLSRCGSMQRHLQSYRFIGFFAYLLAVATAVNGFVDRLRFLQHSGLVKYKEVSTANLNAIALMLTAISVLLCTMNFGISPAFRIHFSTQSV